MRPLAPPPTDPDSDRGSTELVVATPLMLLLLVLVVQVALWAHADHVAQTIAQHGHAATRGVEATEADGHTRATEVATQLSGDLLDGVDIEVERTATTATVRVQASVPTMIPGLDWPVNAEVSGPVERLTPGGGP
ncbi:TadE/TadG family type IV pilus assembly protein [Nocardiopsis synnemataformans]|uniref:TadE/TadG family type IV pilus assembly protein n=1 Tax=Nocardiopsis synnemataformans TaxID=61305 RepID=UPI003EBE2175